MDSQQQLNNLKDLADYINQNRVKRNGFIVLHTIEGFELIPFDEDKLRNIARLLTYDLAIKDSINEKVTKINE